MLPVLPVRTRPRTLRQTVFPGLDRRAGAGGGAICDMENLTGDHAPLLASRPPRHTLGHAAKPNGLFSDGLRLFLADGTALYVDGVPAGAVSDTEKVFAALGKRILIWPDKLLWTEEGGLAPLEAAVTVSCTFADGTYAGEAAEGNTLLAADSAFDWSAYFRAGDAVTISGAADAGNNKTPVVREIDGPALRFYENTFTVNPTAADITVARTVPDLDFLCVNDNRVWGCKGDTIRCCALGDPFNWNVFDGLSTDSWSWDSGTAGDFTGCVSFLGYPVFFKEDAIFKVYGAKPSSFESLRSAATGVLAGAARSLAVAGDTLFYLSPAGFMAYSGGMPGPIGAPLARQYTGAVGGSDGRRYFVSAKYSGGCEMLVWDAQTRLWHREDALCARFMARRRGLCALSDAGALLLLGSPREVPAGAAEEGAFPRSVTFAPFAAEDFGGKYPLRLWLRAETAGRLSVYLRYDNGPWECAAENVGGGSDAGGAGGAGGSDAGGVGGTVNLPLPLRRCAAWQLRITADADFRLRALEQEVYTGERSRK